MSSLAELAIINEKFDQIVAGYPNMSLLSPLDFKDPFLQSDETGQELTKIAGHAGSVDV